MNLTLYSRSHDGIKKASVLPLPVFAAASTSLPLRRWGIAFAWISVSVSKFCSFSAFFTGSQIGSSSNRFSLKKPLGKLAFCISTTGSPVFGSTSGTGSAAASAAAASGAASAAASPALVLVSLAASPAAAPLFFFFFFFEAPPAAAPSAAASCPSAWSTATAASPSPASAAAFLFLPFWRAASAAAGLASLPSSPSSSSLSLLSSSSLFFSCCLASFFAFRLIRRSLHLSDFSHR
mmetsp:Transcript_125267/g.354532  ORF Transcript_125267/g.354532 Transcript_125267/m.354532 type:complete len:236 (-) Transcript_125267:140-847(-)